MTLPADVAHADSDPISEILVLRLFEVGEQLFRQLDVSPARFSFIALQLHYDTALTPQMSLTKVDITLRLIDGAAADVPAHEPQ